MLWLTIGVALLLAALAIGFVVWPLWRSTLLVRVEDDHPLAELIQRKDTVLLSIKELEFDYQTGKLSTEDYQRLDQRLRLQAIALLRQLEKDAPASTGLETELEAAIARQRKRADPRPAHTPNGAGADKRQFCTHCGAPVTATDKFCAQCGTPVKKILTPQAG